MLSFQRISLGDFSKTVGVKRATKWKIIKRYPSIEYTKSFNSKIVNGGHGRPFTKRKQQFFVENYKVVINKQIDTGQNLHLVRSAT